MRSLYLRIWLTVVAALALFALVSGMVVQHHLDAERVRVEGAMQERMAAWADLLQRSLPGPQAPAAEQEAGLREWSQRLRVPMALDDAAGLRIGVSESWLRRDLDRPSLAGRRLAVPLDDGRTLWLPNLGLRRMWAGGRPPGPAGEVASGGAIGTFGAAGPGMAGGERGAWSADLGRQDRPPHMQRFDGPDGEPHGLPAIWSAMRWLPDGMGMAVLLALMFLAVAAGAYPVVRRLTRRLETLQRGVEAFGAGALHQRVPEDGRDEVAAVGASFNRAATRIEALLRSHQSLLANASHELRSPLARLKMAVGLLEDTPAAQRDGLRREIETNIAELDVLVEEVLLASRLDASTVLDRRDRVDLLALAAEEAARTGASVQGEDLVLAGDERLLRRALRNLLENAHRYGGGPIEVLVGRAAPAQARRRAASSSTDATATTPAVEAVEVRVCDRGPGVPEAWRERIFEPFFRLPGHAEREGGVGLGLALVRQIAERHGGGVHCEPREGGGSCFVIRLPLAAPR